MEKRKFGKTGMQVSVLGFGGSEIGYQGASPRTVERLLNSALDGGLNALDTAECYDTSEELIGATVSHRRNDFLLFTKCGHANGSDDTDWDPKMLERSINRSLKRLRTDHVDLVQLHSCDEELLRRGEVVEVLERAKKAGKTHSIGYSGDGADALYAVQSGRFDTLQTSISIADQQAIDLLIPAAAEKQMGVIAKRPIANATWRYSKAPDEWYVRPYWERLQALKYEFLSSSGEAASSTALRFTLSVPGVHTAIVGTSNPDRWRQNATMLEQGMLKPAEFNEIRARWKSVAGKDWVGMR